MYSELKTKPQIYILMDLEYSHIFESNVQAIGSSAESDDKITVIFYFKKNQYD